MAKSPSGTPSYVTLDLIYEHCSAAASLVSLHYAGYVIDMVYGQYSTYSMTPHWLGHLVPYQQASSGTFHFGSI